MQWSCRFDTSTPMKRGAGEWKTKDVGDGIDESIVSDFKQHSHQIDTKVCGSTVSRTLKHSK